MAETASLGEEISGSTLVTVSYEDIIKDPSEIPSLRSALERAYGAGSVGVLAVSGVPGFVEQKRHLLPMGYKLAHLPQGYLEENLTDEKSLYNAGWSHGKEKLGDEPDLAKGSFYFNPLSDKPGTDSDRAKYPLSYPENIWPQEDKIPGFEKSAKDMGSLMKDVVVHLSRHIDAFAKLKNPNYPDQALYTAMKDTEKAKGRLLYYYPLDMVAEDIREDSWIGWHNDSGFLTALAGEIYVDDKTGTILPTSPDPASGLYVVDRDNNVVQVSLPGDCLSVQLGECVQILTGGALVATPHCVRGAASPGVSRISLPCFIDTPPDYRLCMPEGCSREQLFANETPRVPPLRLRWDRNGMTFGEFLEQTFAMYYSVPPSPTSDTL